MIGNRNSTVETSHENPIFVYNTLQPTVQTAHSKTVYGIDSISG